MLLTIARLLHPGIGPDQFMVIQVEGAAFHFQDREFDPR
jgi:hypothetical protein